MAILQALERRLVRRGRRLRANQVFPIAVGKLHLCMLNIFASTDAYAEKHTMSAISLMTDHEFQCFQDTSVALAECPDSVDALHANNRRNKSIVDAAGDAAGTNAGDDKPPMLPCTAGAAHANLADTSKPDAQNSQEGSRKQSTPIESGNVHQRLLILSYQWTQCHISSSIGISWSSENTYCLI